MKRAPARVPGLLLLSTAALLGCRAAPPSAAPQEPRVELALSATPEPAPVAAPQPASELERLVELARRDNRVQEHLRVLCTQIGPRLTGSARLQEACEWSREQLESFGLVSSLERWGEFAVGFERGPWRGGMVAPVALEFECNTFAWTPGTDGPKRGPALAYPTTSAELAALRERIPGAWLVRPPAAALENEAGEVVFAKPAQPAGELVEEVQAALVELGGLGEVRGARGELLITDGNPRIEWDELPKLVQVRLTRSHHDQLWTHLAAGQPVELEFDVANRFVPGPVPLYNVVADLRGDELPDEYVIVSAHLDSWDGAQGAIDNGTGCATTLEAARLLALAGVEPRRTIRFILWTGEEQGLLGSQAYVEQHPELLPRISAVLNHDEGTNYLSGLTTTAAMRPALESACAPIEDLHPEYSFELHEVDGLPSMIGSDQDSFVRAGVPGFFWRQSGRSDYEHYHHTQHDLFEAAIPEYQEYSALVVAVTALNLANLPELLDRTGLKAPEPRRMGVELDGTRITALSGGGRAEAAGLQVGDVLLAIDGEGMRNEGSIRGALRRGASRKVVRIQRGTETLEVVLDWSDDPDEPRRLKQIEARAAREAERRAEREARRGAPAEGAERP
jgi:hypothetical protein